MNNILVSISCITYNHVNYIEDCLRGLLMQKVDFNFEVLIHDDASTDGTREVIKTYQEKYPKIIKPIFQSKNQYSQGQRGFNAKYNYPRARGKYIALCEGDDYWTDPLKLQRQVNIIDAKPNVSIVAHNAKVIDETNNVIREFNETQIPEFTDVKDLLIKPWYLPTSSLLFKKSDLKMPNHKNKVLNGDFLLQLMLTSGGGKVCYINDLMSSYRIHDTGISQQFYSGYSYETSMINLYKLFNKETKSAYKELVFDNISKLSLSKLRKSKKWSADFRSAMLTFIWYNNGISRQEINYVLGHLILPKGWVSSK